MRDLFGDWILDMKYYWCDETDLDGILVVISRTGWTAVVGYEIYLRDPSRGDDLWERILDAGKPYGIRVTPSSDIRRIEAGIFDWGSDIGLTDNPFEVTGLERLVEEQEADYIGKEALERIRREGVSRKLVGIELEGEPVEQPAQHWPAAHSGETAGTSPTPAGRRGWRRTSDTCGCRSGWRRPARGSTWTPTTAPASGRPQRSRSSTPGRRCPPHRSRVPAVRDELASLRHPQHDAGGHDRDPHCAAVSGSVPNAVLRNGRKTTATCNRAERATAPHSQAFENRPRNALRRSERALKTLKSWASTSVVNAIVRATRSLDVPSTSPPGNSRSSTNSVATAIAVPFSAMLTHIGPSTTRAARERVVGACGGHRADPCRRRGPAPHR